jgi:hypothetical protein
MFFLSSLFQKWNTITLMHPIKPNFPFFQFPRTQNNKAALHTLSIKYAKVQCFCSFLHLKVTPAAQQRRKESIPPKSAQNFNQ